MCGFGRFIIGLFGFPEEVCMGLTGLPTGCYMGVSEN